jgi:glucokinase
MYASVTGLIQTAAETAERNPASALHAALRGEGLNGRNVFEICKAGDAAAKEAVETYFTHVGEGVLNMINVFQPEILLIGGGISAEGDYLLEPIRAFVDKGGYSKVAKTKILKAALGNDAGIIGAAMCKLYQ